MAAGLLFDASEVNEVVRDIEQTMRRNVRGQVRATRETAHEGWVMVRASARRTSRRWGKDYPPSIRETREAPTRHRIAPEGKAANWSFEDGSRKQPAHHNFADMADVLDNRLPYRCAAAAVDAFPESWQ